MSAQTRSLPQHARHEHAHRLGHQKDVEPVVLDLRFQVLDLALVGGHEAIEHRGEARVRRVVRADDRQDRREPNGRRPLPPAPWARPRAASRPAPARRRAAAAPPRAARTAPPRAAAGRAAEHAWAPTRRWPGTARPPAAAARAERAPRCAPAPPGETPAARRPRRSRPRPFDWPSERHGVVARTGSGPRTPAAGPAAAAQRAMAAAAAVGAHVRRAAARAGRGPRWGGSRRRASVGPIGAGSGAGERAACMLRRSAAAPDRRRAAARRARRGGAAESSALRRLAQGQSVPCCCTHGGVVGEFAPASCLRSSPSRTTGRHGRAPPCRRRRVASLGRVASPRRRPRGDAPRGGHSIASEDVGAPDAEADVRLDAGSLRRVGRGDLVCRAPRRRGAVGRAHRRHRRRRLRPGAAAQRAASGRPGPRLCAAKLDRRFVRVVRRPRAGSTASPTPSRWRRRARAGRAVPRAPARACGVRRAAACVRL